MGRGTLIAAFLGGVCLLGCGSPEATYERVRREVDRGEFNSTLTEVDKALRRFGQNNTEWEWRFRVLKARILVSRSQGEEALGILKPDLPAELSSTNIPEQRKLYQGIAHRYAQQFAASESDFRDAEILVQPLDAQHVCQFLVAQAALWVDEGKYDAAEANYERALSLSRQSGLPRSEASALADWGRLATTQGRFDRALDLYRDALQRARSLDMQANTATILGNLGWSYFELGDFENALDYYQQAAIASQRSGISGYQLYWLTGVANSFTAQHDYGSAENLLRTTLDLANRQKNLQTVAECLNDLTEIMLKTDRVPEAEKYNREAVVMEQSGADHFGAAHAQLLLGRIATANRDFNGAAAIFDSLIQDAKIERPIRWNAQAELGRVREEQGRYRDAQASYLDAIATIEDTRRSIDHDELRLSFLSGGIEVYGEYVDFLVRRGRPADALMQAEVSRARTLAEGMSSDQSRPVSMGPPERLAGRLHATLLFYWLGERRSHLWVITPKGLAYFALPPAKEIEATAKSYRQAVLSGRSVLQEANSDGMKLYGVLIEPAQKLIPYGSRVILLPDGGLHGLSFETLIVSKPKPHYWIEDVVVSTGTSLALLESSASEHAAGLRNLLVIGNTLPPSDNFPALPQAAAEIDRVKKYFRGPRGVVLARDQATPRNYLNGHPEGFAYLHFVTHGIASRAHPLESAVILSAEGNDPASYKLYARDIVRHPLAAYLVTISACNGSGTRAYSGEGLVGLSWAFLRAGARNVIAALWEVNDASTPQLMDRMYGELSQGHVPADALRAAKLSLLHSDGVFQKPFYWAPFQLYTGGSGKGHTSSVSARRNAD